MKGKEQNLSSDLYFFIIEGLMSVREVTRMGNPVLRQVGEKIPIEQIKSE